MIHEIVQLWFEKWRSAIEILLLSVVIYYGYLYFRGTRGAKVLTGLAIVFLTLTLISQLLNLAVISFIIRSFSVFLAVALVVIFQPELRRALAELGGHPIFSLTSEKRETVHDLAEVVTQLSNKQFGALIAIERDTSIKVYEETGVIVDARVLDRAAPDLVSSEIGAARWRSDFAQRAHRGGGLHFSREPARNPRSHPRPATSRRARHHRRIGRSRGRRFRGNGLDLDLSSSPARTKFYPGNFPATPRRNSTPPHP